jgi:hypothetical protein
MIGNYFARLTGSKRNLLALFTSSVIFTAGCANMTSTAPTGANPFSSPALLNGKIHGGNQPVSGATVNLWFAGQSGAATLAATTTSDSTGSFSFIKDTTNGNTDTGNEYSCPASTDPLVYVVAQGGNTQNNGIPAQTNTAAAFIAIYGDCKELTASNFVFMSEVTTVATMAAIGQFYNPNDGTIRADGTGQQKNIIDNIHNTIALLADPTTGLSVASTTIPAATGGNSNIAPGVSLIAQPESGKINLLANIISSCINGATSAAPACTTLFTAAVPPFTNTTNLNPGGFFPTATNTLQALYYIFTNPSNGSAANVATLFGLSPATGAPYLPSAPKPTDWTIGISYTSNSTCGASGGFLNSPTDINIDGLDNVWIANAQTGGNLSAISATGAPLVCLNQDAGFSSAGGFVDAASNVWIGAGTTLYRYNPTTKATLAFPVALSALGITGDGAGNVYFTAASAGVGSLYELPLAASVPAAVAPIQISNTVGPNPVRLMPNYQGTTSGTLNPVNIWVSSGAKFISQVSPTTATTGNVLNGFLTTQFTTSGNSYGISVTSGAAIAVSSIDNGAIDLFTPTSTALTAWAPAGGNWPFTAAASAGISSPTGMSVDSRGNIWLPNNTNGTGTGSISSVNVDTQANSPATGFQKDASFLHSGRALAIDQAGNLWVAGDGNNFVTEFVGGVPPVYQPYSVGLLNSRFQKAP